MGSATKEKYLDGFGDLVFCGKSCRGTKLLRSLCALTRDFDHGFAELLPFFFLLVDTRQKSTPEESE
jgi:hypothetical protein